MDKQRNFPVHVLLCVVPWAIPLAFWILPLPLPLPAHIAVDDLRLIKMAAIWSLCVALAGLAWSLIDMAKNRRIVSALSAAVAAGYLGWYPWEGIGYVLKL